MQTETDSKTNERKEGDKKDNRKGEEGGGIERAKSDQASLTRVRMKDKRSCQAAANAPWWFENTRCCATLLRRGFVWRVVARTRSESGAESIVTVPKNGIFPTKCAFYTLTS